MELSLLSAGLFLGLLTARSGTVASRGGIEHSNPAVVIINFLAMISTFALIVWGFMNATWWMVILAFLVFSFVVGALVSRERWALFFSLIPITGSVAVVINGYLWFFN
ncbi:hypothetical protein ACED27_23175 [Vibrio sp. FF112]|uniref:hypothetical protein n=1 Tax=Vibrio TaxID=662 RepID=UPI00352E52ED